MSKILTYEDYYEFGCKYDKPVAETNKFKITTGLNIDGHLNYVKIYRKGEKGVCRLRIDNCFCQYWVSDFSLHDKEIDEIKPILKKKWKEIINIINAAKIKENLKPLIRLRTKLFMPNYNKIKGEEGTKVTIEVLRGAEKLKFELTREKVKVNQVEGKVLSNNIGYIKVSSFSEPSLLIFNFIVSPI